MRSDIVVIEVDEQLDRDATVAVASAMNAALECGQVTMFDLDRSRAVDAAGAPVTASADEPAIHAVAEGAGYLRLGFASTTWTIDFARSRLLRSDPAVDRRFVGEPSWDAISAIWVAPSAMSAHIADGRFVSAVAPRAAA